MLMELALCMANRTGGRSSFSWLNQASVRCNASSKSGLPCNSMGTSVLPANPPASVVGDGAGVVAYREWRRNHSLTTQTQCEFYPGFGANGPKEKSAARG